MADSSHHIVPPTARQELERARQLTQAQQAFDKIKAIALNLREGSFKIVLLALRESEAEMLSQVQQRDAEIAERAKRGQAQR